MRHCLIFNPQAGSGRAVKQVLHELVGKQNCELRPTSRDVGTRQMARMALDDGFDRIIVAGGDGTISQVVNGIAPDFSEVQLAVLPFGTGNDLARSLGFTPDQLSAASQAFGCRVETIDLMRVDADDGTTWCVNAAHGGLGGQVAADVHSADKQRWGSLAYWITSVSHIIDLEEFDVTLDLDGDHVELRTVGVAVANGRFVGGGFPISPKALLNDGYLDVTTVPVLPTHELMAAGINFALGRDQYEDRVRHYRARRIRLHTTPSMPFSIDGELARRIDADFEVIPQALQVVVGMHPPGLTPPEHSPPFIH